MSDEHQQDEHQGHGHGEGEHSRELQVELGIVEYPELSAYVLQGEGLNGDTLTELLMTALDAVFGAELQLQGPPMVQFLEIPDQEETLTNVTALAIIPVDPEAAIAAGLEVAMIGPITTAASARFRGPHEAKPQVYALLFDFMQEQQFQPVGLPRELFWEVREDGEHLTELAFPVQDLLPPGQRMFEGESTNGTTDA